MFTQFMVAAAVNVQCLYNVYEPTPLSDSMQRYRIPRDMDDTISEPSPLSDNMQRFQGQG
jgi:hypothetical protein